MRIFVLNSTGQHVVFGYRLDYLVDDKGNKTMGNAKPYRTLPIPARTQMQLGGDWDPIQGSEIIQQLEDPAVGGVHTSNIKTAKAAGQVRLVWSQDKVIPKIICEDVFYHNVHFMSNEGARRRETMALANSSTADAATGVISSAFSVDIETVDEATGSVSPQIKAGYRVNKQRKETPPKKTRSRRAAG